MNITAPFLIIAAIFEGFFAITHFGWWSHLGAIGTLALASITLHIICYNLCKSHGFARYAPIIGGSASVLGIIPIAGNIIHGIACGLYIYKIITHRKELFKNHEKELGNQDAIGISKHITDDLTKIEGIGPTIAHILHESGCISYAHLASRHPRDITELLAQNHIGGHDATTWPEQAILARDGKWKELKLWQDILDGGREVTK